MTRRTINKGLLVLLAVGWCPAAATGAVTGDDVRGAVAAGVARIRQMQRPNGAWQERIPGGDTALCVLAMLNAGVPADDPAVLRGLKYLQGVPNQRTYAVSLKAQAFAAADPDKYAADIRAAANWLVRAQQKTGMWSYTQQGRGDNSNTQFALLGLHEASKAGVDIPRDVWEKARRHYENTQFTDGSWAYNQRQKGYGSMSAAGLASLFICGQQLHVGGRKVFVDGAYPDCGKYQQNKVIAAGLGWMTRNFTVTENPGSHKAWHKYFLYGMERVGMISGLRNFGRHDWYREGAEYLVGAQKNGQWGELYDTAFSLLFLAKGNRPVLVQKLKWDGQWNRNVHDLEHLCGFIGEKLGKPVTWQTASLGLPVRELRVSPILYITGHEFPKFTDDEKKKLRRFIETGGTLLFEACCGSKDFDTGFRAFAREVFPEYALGPLPQSHPVFRSYYPLKGPDTGDLEGLDYGCRTSVFYSPKALSALWELQEIPVHSERAFKLATNIAAYATGREALADKLDEIALAAQGRKPEQFEVPRGAVRIARLIHEGDYKADIHAIAHLAELLRTKARIDVVPRERHLKATDEKLFEYPVVFMTGHYAFKLSDKEIEALRKYLQRGGILIADACCGRKEFDTSFRELAAKLLPGEKLTPLEADHPIYTGEIGRELGEVRYRRVLAEELKARGTRNPPLEVLRTNGRIAVIYSKYDWSCALEGDRPFGCRGYLDEDGQKLALNIFLYAISY